MKRIFLNFFICALLLFSCNAATESTQNEALTTDQKFVGDWLVVDNNFGENKNDHSMDGIIQSLTKMEGRDETYTFKLYTGNNLILSKRDDNTLTGVNANMKVRYVDSTQHIILAIGNEDKMEFKKLK